MHEASMASALLRLVQEEANRYHVTAITGISLQVGVFVMVEPHALTACFELLAEGSVAENAVIDVETGPATARCRACGKTFELMNVHDRCPVCGSSDLTCSGGRAFMITGLRAAGPEQTQGTAL